MLKEANLKKRIQTLFNMLGDTVCQRVESHRTSVGIPDFFIAYKGTVTWLEVKSQMKQGDQRYVRVDWRPGQQAWLYATHKASDGNVGCYTLVELGSRYVVIRHDHIYTDDLVPLNGPTVSIHATLGEALWFTGYGR